MTSGKWIVVFAALAALRLSAQTVPVTSGLVLDLDANAGVTTGSGGAISAWADQSTLGNSAWQSYGPDQPTLLANQINGNAAVSFNGSNTLNLPQNMLQTETAGEIIGVVLIGNNPDTFNMLWNFGTGYGSSYYNTLHFDDFGTSDTSAVTVETQAQVSQFFIYDTSISAAGTSTYRWNGIPLWTRTGLSVGFQQYPDIGGWGDGSFVGQIAEILIYDHVLSDSDRFSIGQYLATKYAFPAIVVPATPSDLAAIPVSSDTVDLSWTGQYTSHTVATISRAVGTGSYSVLAQVSDSSSYVDQTVSAGNSYSYQVVVQSYAGSSGTSNTASVSVPTGMPDIPTSGLQFWVRSTVGTEGAGSVTSWSDQSGQGNISTAEDPTNAPQLIANQANGLPVVRFSGATGMNLPNTLMQTATAGQLFAVVKIPLSTNQYNVLWNFGFANGSSFSTDGSGNTIHFEDFGNNNWDNVSVDSTEIAQYFLYDTSIDSSGNLIYRYDGTPEWTKTGQTVGFSTTPDIGGAWGGSLYADIAEIIVYNRVLSPDEQATVYSYLATRYSLSNVSANLADPVITSSSLITSNVGQPFSYQITATNGGTGFTATGLPDGLTLDPSTGIISGSILGSYYYPVSLTATNASGTSSTTLFINALPPVGQTIPYTTGFESSDGFSTGSIAGQSGWTVPQGSASIATDQVHGGSQSLRLDPGSPVGIAALSFSDAGGETIEYTDFYALPVAEAAISDSSLITVEGAQFGFQQVNGVGVLQVLHGDGAGGSDWITTSVTIPLNAQNQAASWVRLTVKMNFGAKTWDLYVNGNLAIQSVPFVNNSSSFLSVITFTGDANNPSYIDDLYVGPVNPLFTDVSNDGIPDAWETANGLDPTVDNSNAHDFSSTYTDLQVYELGLNPANGQVSDNAAVALHVYTPHN